MDNSESGNHNLEQFLLVSDLSSYAAAKRLLRVWLVLKSALTLTVYKTIDSG